MTNLFAVKITYEGKPHIFCVADSQSTNSSDGTKRSEQKLVQRGHNLIMDTGHAGIAYEVYEKLLGKDGTAPEIAELILKLTEDYAKRNEGNMRMHSGFLVAGKDKDGVGMYSVSAINHEKSVRGIQPIPQMYSDGVGGYHVRPAFNRDTEMGYAKYPETPLEAMFLCFKAGIKANDDLGVDSKLQYGFVSGDISRLLIPPGVNPASIEDVNTIYTGITGVKFELTKENYSDFIEAYQSEIRTVYAFYHAMETMMHRLDSVDIKCNMLHTKLKSGKAIEAEAKKKQDELSPLDRAISDYQTKLEDLQEAKANLLPFVGAFLKGGLDNIVPVVREFDKQQEKEYANALSSLEAQRSRERGDPPDEPPI
jgi:hypothetical protein